jgi:signal transduction histidine kinase
LTVTRERNRLARELHDTLAHTLTALSVSLETAKAYFEIDPAQTRHLLDKSLDTTRAGVEETRRTLKALRSSALEDLGLELAIRRLAESMAERFQLHLELDLPEDRAALSPDVEECIYRVAQEAIQNAAQHARAQKLSVALTANGSGTILSVTDDGKGFDFQDKTHTGHFGLVGMRERAALVGGRLTVDSVKEKGTRVVLVI